MTWSFVIVALQRKGNISRFAPRAIAADSVLTKLMPTTRNPFCAIALIKTAVNWATLPAINYSFVIMQNFPPVSTWCRIALTGIVITLSLAGCAGLRQTSRLTIPPPPAALHDLEEPTNRTPALASRHLAPQNGSPEKELLMLFERWREAWKGRDFDAYLAHYAPAYSGSGTPSLRWQMRRLRMVQGKTAQAVLEFGKPELEIVDDEQALLSFPQHFEDGDLSEIGTKQWQLRRFSGRWLIEQEIFERRSP